MLKKSNNALKSIKCVDVTSEARSTILHISHLRRPLDYSMCLSLLFRFGRCCFVFVCFFFFCMAFHRNRCVCVRCREAPIAMRSRLRFQYCTEQRAFTELMLLQDRQRRRYSITESRRTAQLNTNNLKLISINRCATASAGEMVERAKEKMRNVTFILIYVYRASHICSRANSLRFS